jgi:hypothetical protein
MMQSGLGELEANTMLYLVDALATEADLWGIVNNTLGKLTDSERYNVQPEKSDDENHSLMIWRSYKNLTKTGLDKLFK